jgi:hypothetical protein
MDNQFPVADLVDDPMVALPHSVKFTAGQLCRAWGAWLIAQPFDSTD